MVILPGTKIIDDKENEYKVIEFVGNGSFGNVYRIENVKNNKQFALKTLMAPIADETSLKAFINEGNLATKIHHENVIRYHYFHDGSQSPDMPPYIIMDYADGGTLYFAIQEHISTGKNFENQELLELFTQLINGMEAINDCLVHRDIKPDNILIMNNKIKITDFGLSKIVQESTRKSTFKGFGCIQYMAPEGWTLDKNTVQMDIYSMGFVFYELATLNFPLEVGSNDIQDWRDAHLFQNAKPVDHRNPKISPVISQIITKMIRKEHF